MTATTITTACPVDCGCHVSMFASCTVAGGCGSEGCGRQQKTRGSCPSCWRLDPEPGDGRVCGSCQRWLPIAVRSIINMTGELPELIVPADRATDDRWYWHTFPRRKNPDTGELLPPEGEWRRAEPLTAVGGAALTGGRRKQPRVSGGGGGAPVPVRLDVLDLLGPVVREGGRPVDSLSVDAWATKVPQVVAGDEVKVPVRDLRMVPIRDEDNNRIVGEELVEQVRTIKIRQRRVVRNDRGEVLYVTAGDQVGQIPVGVVLDQEVRAWIEAGAPGSRWRPVPTVPELGRWLVNRLPWAVEHYGPMDEFRIMISRLRGLLMNVLDEFDPEPEPCKGVECNRCDRRLLFRRNDGTGDVECQNPACRKVFDAVSYQEWVKHQAAYHRSLRTPEEVRQLLRPTYRPPADTPA